MGSQYPCDWSGNEERGRCLGILAIIVLVCLTVIPTLFTSNCGSDCERNYTEFWTSVRELVGDDCLYPKTFDVSQVTTALRQAKINHVDLFMQQTSLKFKMVLEGGQTAIFKPMIIDRENTSRRTCNAGCEHPEYEVAAFTLNRLFDLRNMPYTTGRILSWSKELEHVASSELKNFIQVQDDHSVCFNWTCLYQNATTYCLKNGEIPGAMIYFLDKTTIAYFRSKKNTYHGYHIYGIDEKRNLNLPPGDKMFCHEFRRSFPYKEDTWFLDIVEQGVLDYLLSHMDSKHRYIIDVGRNNTPLFNVMFDFGHAYCKTEKYHVQSLAPLIQCCRIRTRFFNAMENLSNTLEETFLSATKDDPLHPLLLPELMEENKKKLKQILSLIAVCRNLDGDTEVLINL